jgi:hypothetical protein
MLCYVEQQREEWSLRPGRDGLDCCCEHLDLCFLASVHGVMSRKKWTPEAWVSPWHASTCWGWVTFKCFLHSVMVSHPISVFLFADDTYCSYIYSSFLQLYIRTPSVTRASSIRARKLLQKQRPGLFFALFPRAKDYCSIFRARKCFWCNLKKLL